MGLSAERQRLADDQGKKRHWRRWGPYLSEREWGTVREDLSEEGEPWRSFTFDHAIAHAYRWGEDGIAGISDNHQRLCFAWTFWNGRDAILKERLFGVSGKEGNHGEDVKELYFYLDSLPTHAYMKYLYKYPQAPFPYEKLKEESARRSTSDPEFELLDTGVFEGSRYFDITIEYAKRSPDEIYLRCTVTNRGPEKSTIHLLPTVWFRNTWSWGGAVQRPMIRREEKRLAIEHETLGAYSLHFPEGAEVLFTENETGLKDAFHRYLIRGEKEAIHQHPLGTKSGLHFTYDLAPGASQTVTLLLSASKELVSDADETFSLRRKEADLFYEEVLCPSNSSDQKLIQRQAFAGMLWSEQFYHFVVDEWIKRPRKHPRNQEWIHLYNDDVLSVPDKWEYPSFFSWDTAFHALPLAMVDPAFAKRQMTLLTREWYMHPSGQIPASEWSFGEVNPPVHAWATHRVFKIEKKMTGEEDRLFLESVFQKLLLNFTWWVNRKDSGGKNVFEGGFLGLDNISLFNRSELPHGVRLYQCDATSWMGMYSLNMLSIALTLAEKNPSYEDMASKFFEHFLYIAKAVQAGPIPLWDPQDGFYYDVAVLPTGEQVPIRVRSMVGLIPLFAVATASPDQLNQFPGFRRRMEWFIDHRRDLCGHIASMKEPGDKGRRLLSLVTPDRLRQILGYLLNEAEFLSPYGIRSLSKFHESHPYRFQVNGDEREISYEPAESHSKLYGGNSNWRGPIWFCLNFLLIESLQKYHHYFGDGFKVECPTGSGKYLTLWEVAAELSRRLVKVFEPGEAGRRPLFGRHDIFASDPHFRDLILFYEYFDGNSGAGLGASHQTGWTALVAKIIQQLGEHP